MSKQRAIIKRMEIKGLWGRQDFVLDFHDDLNILTGSNGSGKTTILRMLWSISSGNFKSLIVNEKFKNINFNLIFENKIEILFEKIIESKINEKVTVGMGSIAGDGGSIQITEEDDNGDVTISPPVKTISFSNAIKNRNFDFSSIFMPTFRRIENEFAPDEEKKFNITNGLKEYSDTLSRNAHQFIAFAGVEDLKNQINLLSSDIRVRLEPIEKEFTAFISNGGQALDPQEFKQQVNHRLATKVQQEAEITQPLTTLSRLIDELMLEKSVQVTEELVLGTHPTRVPLEGLSGGEKNLLSFMVYAMHKPAIMFIDEPELGMHQDWQREFIRMMREISPETQYFIASHASPVRAAYPDKQIFLDEQIREV